MVNKPAIVLGVVAAVSIGFTSFFYTRYVNLVAKANEQETINSRLLQQVGELSKEKEQAEAAYSQSQSRASELKNDLEKSKTTISLQDEKIHDLETKALGLEAEASQLKGELSTLEAEALNLKTQKSDSQKQLADSNAEADKYKEDHKYPDSVVDELKKELTGLNDQIKNYFGLKARLEEVEDLYKKEKEDKAMYERELEAVRESLESSYALLHKWLEYVDETYLGRVRDRIEELIEDKTRLESIMDKIFDPANIKSGHNKGLYYQVVEYIADEQARQRRLEEGPFKPLVERESATEDLILREQGP